MEKDNRGQEKEKGRKETRYNKQEREKRKTKGKNRKITTKSVWLSGPINHVVVDSLTLMQASSPIALIMVTTNSWISILLE